MSTSHNWKKLGANSGNMYTHRNIKANKLNYTGGKWKDIENTDGKKIGISYSVSNSITNENMLVGVGTTQPFSRLSLGSNTNDGSSNEILGRLAAIAVHENSDGTDFHGLSYVTDISSAFQDGDGKTNALALYANPNDQQLITENAHIYITDENITTIGGKPRKTFDDWDNQPVRSDSSGVPIKIDCKGSLNVSGFISFMDLHNIDDSLRDNPANKSGNINDPNATRNIPVGSIWAGYTSGQTNVALFIQDLSGKRQIIGTGSGGGGGSSDISGILWDGSQNNTAEDSWIGKGGSNITFTPSTDTSIIGGPSLEPNPRPPNAITITQGNLSVVGKDYYSKKVTNDDTNIPSTSFGLSSDDTVGGIIWAERQIAIGIKGGNSVIDVKPKALLDISGNVARVPSIIINTSSNINSATDSVIISSNSSNIGKFNGDDNNTAKSSIIIGNNNVWASDKSIILGTNNLIGNGDDQCIADCANNIIVLGQNNTAINEINTCIIGKQNIVDSSGNTNSKGNVIFGTGNTYYSKSGDNVNENNLIIGDTNSLIDSEYSIISGNNNDTSGKNNLTIGNENKIGFGGEITVETTTKKANNSYVLGNNNEINAHNASPITNTYMFGTNNEYDATDNSFINNVNSSTIIFGDRAKINWTSDVSNQRFIFSTQEKYVENGSTTNGHVFTIDKSGNTVIEGDLTVRGNKSITDLCGNDASFNNVYILQNLSGNDASFNNVDVVDLCGNDASFNNVDVVDLCGNDASFNNVDIDNILKTNTINNNGDSNMTIENIQNDKDIIFKTNKSGASTTAITIDGSAKETLFYGGYSDTDNSGVTIDANGNLKMNGKLTVDGLIDPTGLVLTKQNGNPNSSDSSADHLTLFFDQTSGGLQYVTRNDAGDAETKVIATGSSGGSGGGTAIEGNAETASNLKKGTNRGLLHQTGDELTSILAYGSSNGKFLKSTGSAPTWSDLPTAGDNSVGGIKTGYSNTGDDKNYAVQLSEGKAYVNVEWEDTNTTYEVMGSGNSYADGLVPEGDVNGTKFLKQNGSWATPTDTDTTYDVMGSGNSYAAGLVLAGASGGTGFLKQNGTWATPTNTEYKAGTGITINGDNEISLSDPGLTATVTVQDTDGNSSTLEFRNGLLVSGLTNGTTTGDITFGGTTLTFTNGFLTSQTTASGN